tara:strand:- start:1374 stop:2645 length:1272 start_codon:yes stop_codon:yes gene_type:complete
MSNKVTVNTGNIKIVRVSSPGIRGFTGPAGPTGNVTSSADVAITGNLTASGNISASGTIYASKFESSGTSNEVISFNDNLNITGHITSSGNISASGTVTALSSSFNRIDFQGSDYAVVFSGSVTQTGSIGHLILSDNSLQLGGVGGTRFTKADIDNLKLGKSIIDTVNKKSFDADIVGAESVTESDNFVRPEIILHPTDDESAIITKTAGRWYWRSAGGDPFEIFADGETNDYIRLGSTTTNATRIKMQGIVDVSGSLTVSGSSTFTNWGNFRNRLHVNNRAFEVSTDPTAAGGYREGMSTPNVAHKPHLHFMLSGSGQAGVGLLNPEHTLHVSASSENFNALQVEGTAVVNGFLGANSVGNPSILTGNTVVPAGYNILLYTSNANPSITVPSLSNYTISTGASVRLVNMDNVGNIPQTFYNQ